MNDDNPRLKGSMGGQRPSSPARPSTAPTPPFGGPTRPPSPTYPSPPPRTAYPPAAAPPPAPAGYPAAPSTGYPAATPASYPATAPMMPGPAMPAVVTDQKKSTALIVVAWIFAVGTLFYLLPWAIAVTRGKSNAMAIGVLNFLLGWTFIGWVASLVMACGSHNVVATGGMTNITVVQAGFAGAPQPAPGYPTGPAQPGMPSAWGGAPAAGGPSGVAVDTTAQPTWPPQGTPELPR